jgi:hypothetical protein
MIYLPMSTNEIYRNPVKVQLGSYSKINEKVITSPSSYEDFVSIVQPIISGTPDIIIKAANFKQIIRKAREPLESLPHVSSIREVSTNSFGAKEMAAFYLYRKLKYIGVRTLHEHFLFKQLEKVIISNPTVKMAYSFLNSIKDISKLGLTSNRFNLELVKKIDPFIVAELMFPKLSIVPIVRNITNRHRVKNKPQGSWDVSVKKWLPNPQSVTPKYRQDPINTRASIHSYYFSPVDDGIPSRFTRPSRLTHRPKLISKTDISLKESEFLRYAFTNLDSSYTNNASTEIISTGLDLKSTEGHFNRMTLDGIKIQISSIDRSAIIFRRSTDRRRSLNRFRWRPGVSKWRTRHFRYREHSVCRWHLKGKRLGSGQTQKRLRSSGWFA